MANKEPLDLPLGRNATRLGNLGDDTLLFLVHRHFPAIRLRRNG
jgi:hypothetical protein